MEASTLDPERDSSQLPDAGESNGNRRRSGRVRRKPEFFSSQTFSQRSTKRKRRSGHEEANDASDSAPEPDEDDEDLDDEDVDDTEGEADEEELKERRRALRRAAKSKNKEDKKTRTKRAAKKPRVANGSTAELAFRPAVNGQGPPAKTKKSRARPSGLATDEEGLFAEVFARGHTTDAVAAEWLTKYEQHNVNAMCDLVNFILRCTGTDLKVENHDIEDVDNVPNKLEDLQEEYQAQSITEYPLISKSKQYRSFETILSSFFDSLIRTIHSSSVLYNDHALFENIQVWVSSMSSASIRPFRHTATIISLTMVTTFCHLAREVSNTLSNTTKQMETEKRKKTVNKGRVSAMQTKIEECGRKLQNIEEALRDSFDTVFVHRYRDVDPKIRAACMAALGAWIMTYKEMFFDGQYLRYLGWVLSDTIAQTRAVVVQQLHRLYQDKDNIAGLRSFTERFRPRIVEMAMRDAEVSVRATAVELLDLIREAGLLEPDDIDSIGRLVFDAEPRVRKAAGKFFVSNIRDVYDATIEGMEEDINEFFADEDEDNFQMPKRSWIKYKCLVDILQIYDGQKAELHEDQTSLAAWTSFVGGRVSSRHVLATEAIYPYLKELEQWESLAGYLLYDHSQIPDQPDDRDASVGVKRLFKLNEGQEPILLEVLSCAVKLNCQAIAKSDTDKRGRKPKQLAEQKEEQEETIAHNLSQIIPQLLNKYGAVPEAASAVLRLEHLVNLDLIQDLQKGAAAYSELLNNINKQFLSHSDPSVLSEATLAFLHAQTSDELKEVIESKVQELWDNTTDTLRNLASSRPLDETQSLSTSVQTTLSNTVTRISNLGCISDCSSILETIPTGALSKQKRPQEPLVNILLTLAKRGLREEETDEESRTLERELILGSFKTLLLYFMWKIRTVKTALSSGDKTLDGQYFEELAERRESFVSVLTDIMQQRSGIDDLRLAATTTLLDLQTTFATLRSAAMGEESNVQSLDENVLFRAQGLAQEIAPETQTLISRIHDASERYFAKKSNRKLEPVTEDEPIDSESEIGISSEEEESAASDEDDEAVEIRRTRATLLAEQKLCELTGKIVLAIVGRVLDATGPNAGELRQKLLRNKAKLGPNYKEILAYLEDEKAAVAGSRKLARDRRKQAAPNGTAGGSDRNEKPESAERGEESEEEEHEQAHAEEDEEEDLRARDLLEEENGRASEEEPQTPRTPIDDDIMGD
ncbi:hypothetical protein VTO42DRAFT_6053 [Malbranchea cinnamomea]